MKEARILVTGGGTGGHVAPALAVIREIRERAKTATDWQPVFQYVGSAAGLEARLAGEAGVPFVGVQSGKLRRSRRWTGLFSRANFRDLLRVPVGIAQSWREVRRFRPDVVLSTGGYVSVPAVVAAGLLKIPVLVHEQTVQIGLANRIAARFATRIALSFEGAVSELPPNARAKAFVTGNPVRREIFGGDQTQAIARFGFAPEDNSLPTVYVTGGAQGARIINRAIESVLPELLSHCRIIHQCGSQPEGQEQDFDRLTATEATLPETLRRRYALVRFVGDEIGDVFALANLIVGRSGAGTVTETAALGKASVFVPLVPTGGDEQTRNARRMVEAGAALIIPQDEFDGQRLLSELVPLLADPARLEAMGQAAFTLARPNAARDLADAVLGLAGVQ